MSGTSESGKKFPFIRDHSRVKNLAGWTLSPLKEVGSPSGCLTTTMSASDTVTLRGCKGQQYTSWDCLSRFYVGGATTVVVDKMNRPPHLALKRDIKLGTDYDIPTQDELANLNKLDSAMVRSGRKFYVCELDFQIQLRLGFWAQQYVDPTFGTPPR